MVSRDQPVTVRLSVPDIEESDIAKAVAILKSGWLSQGRWVAAFEREFASLVETPYAVAVSSGTAALHVALLAAGVRQGDRVAVSAYSWPATANAVVLSGAEPVFVDIERRTFGMDPQQLEEALIADPGIGTVLPVHAFGCSAEIREIVEIASRHGVQVVEDAACAIGAVYEGRPIGAWGRMGCFSFHPRKIVTTGEGGMVTTSDETAERRLRSLRNHGLDPAASRPDFIEPGLNYRLTEFQAALGLGQLGRLADLIAARQALASRYDELLRGTGIDLHAPERGSAHVYQSYVVLLPPGASTNRAAILARLRERGIEATIGTHHIPLTTWYRQRFGFGPGQFPVTDDVASRAIALPLHSRLTQEHQAKVARELSALV
jgi:perosamine synthetase